MNKQRNKVGLKSSVSNNALKQFEVLLGQWKTEGSHGLLPNVTLNGRASFEWIENGAFLLMRTEINNDSRFPSGIAIIGSDNTKNKLFMLYFDERGVSRIFKLKIKDKVIKWWRDHPGFSQRYTNTISDDGNSITSRGELSKDGINWEKDLDLVFTRIE